jgi:anti-sigma regulatory factor (Ser/Thr protein kinase)
LERLSSQVEADVVERSRLVVTEVVTNSVRHARLTPPQLIELEVSMSPELLRIEVTDNGPGFAALAAGPDRGNGASDGWGLWLVDRLTDRWGVDGRHGTCVWLEFDCGPEQLSAA